MQLTKENLFPAIQELKSCLEMTGFMLSQIQIKEDLLKDEKYKHLYSVEAVNAHVLSGIPFRDAYKNVGNSIENNDFNLEFELDHTHEGSIGNLCNEQIVKEMGKLKLKILK